MLALLVIVAIAGGGFWVTHRRSVRDQTTGSSSDSIKSVLHLESFVVNLADTEQASFFRVGIDLGLGPGSAKGDEKGSPLTPKIRDVILSVLTTWRSSDLIAPEGKSKLKDQLLKALQDRVPELSVQEIYFTEFLVQR